MNTARLCLPKSRSLVLKRFYADPPCPTGGGGKGKPPAKRRIFQVYRFGGVLSNEKPRMQNFELDITGLNMMLDVMTRIKEIDPSFTYRRSCREGICGSCAICLQGSNTLACIAVLPEAKKVTIHPLPHMYVIRDLVVDMTHFFNAYSNIRPYLIRKQPISPLGANQYAQTPEEMNMVVGLYECVLCACCSTACPSYWWNGRRFIGPAALLHAYRWTIDSRDDDTEKRLYDLRDDFKAFRCHVIMNCTLACPKSLNPALMIARLKRMIAGLDKKASPKQDPMELAARKFDQSPKPV